ncbi:MAG TPA: SH3 domain-containing protein [Acidobacteriota bacterium]|nr:SH3 domain-containing protein [Acidobacteriota bacterium]HQF86282.1 SH3 domain-containing protein [Acidobacteriota bacterium]HQG90475.1 SH3 domain-containing protein [Acidobacteriota bacterium]HQK86041.1 SH3 domain-containing protein [Acidobacteriota bacterium]
MKPIVAFAWLIVGLLVGWVAATVPSETPASMGVHLYGSGQYDAADRAWRQAAHATPGNAELYYNLGCAAFRRHRLGEAVLYFQRTLWLNPGHADASHNIRYINSLTIDKVPQNPPGVPQIIRDVLVSWLGVNGVSGLMLGAFVAICLAGWYALRVRDLPHRRTACWIFAASLLLGIASAILLWGVVVRDSSVSEGVILARQQDVRSGPSQDNPVLFTVHEGLVVELVARTEGWWQVVLPNGWNGWVPENRLGVVQSSDLPISASPSGTE